jgi:predicted amidohydrolase
MSGKITIATCQFPVGSDVQSNAAYIQMQMRIARSRNADIAHFSECSLSGYAGMDFDGFQTREEHQLVGCLQQIEDLASDLNLWVIVGSHHHESGMGKPYNSLYVINPEGEMTVRYDKRLLTGGDVGSDQQYYTPGIHPVTFSLNGIRCGLLICHEWRYGELYRQYERLGTQLIFQSWYDGKMTYPEYQDKGQNLGEVIVGTVRGNAANNHLWISASNTSKKESCFPAFVVRPDGAITSRLRRNETGVLITPVDTSQHFEDPSGHLRDSLDLLH